MKSTLGMPLRIGSGQKIEWKLQHDPRITSPWLLGQEFYLTTITTKILR